MEIILLILIYVFIMIYKLKNKTKKQKNIFSIMYIHLCGVAYVTILPIDFTLDPKWLYHESISVDYGNIIPFEDLIKNRRGAKKGIILNIIMTIPFGFILSMMVGNIKFIKVMFSTFILSLSIELIQLIMTIFLLNHRSFDVTDLITNTLGGIIGFIAYKLINTKGFIDNLLEIKKS